MKSRKQDRCPKVFMGLRDVAGFYYNLEYCLRLAGVRCSYVSLEDHPFKYGDRPFWFIRWCRSLNRKRFEKSKSSLQKKIFFLVFQTCKLLILIWAIPTHQVFLFSSGRSFFGTWDLRILRFLKKRIVFQYHGSDSRPPFLNGSYVHVQSERDLNKLANLSRQYFRVIQKVETYADAIINYPPMSHFFSKPLINYLALGLPSAQRDLRKNEELEGTRVRVLHSPSNPLAKGSAEIKEVVLRLKKKGLDFDYIELSGVPHYVVLSELERCSFIIDQLYSDAPMAGFATEAAQLGKPAIVGSYYAKDIFKECQGFPLPPTIFISPSELEETLEQMITKFHLRKKKALEIQSFMEQSWSPLELGHKYKKIFCGDFPTEWLFDPAATRYFNGWGASEKRLRTTIKMLYEKHGWGVFCFEDKPKMKEAFKVFALKSG